MDCVRVDFPEPFGPAIKVRVGTLPLGGVRLQFANDLVVFTGRGARQPSNLEFPAIGLLHYIETLAIEVEDWEPGGKRFEEGLVTRCPHGLVKLRAIEIVGGGHA